MNKPTFNAVTGSTPDAVVVQIREAERTGKHLVLDRIVRIGKPMPASLIMHRGAKPVAIWRVKTFQIVTKGSRTTSVVEWQERGLCALAAVGTLIASFFVPLIPRKMAWYCLAGALLGWATQYFLLIYGVAFFEIASFLDDSKLTFEREAKPAVIEMLVRAQSAITEAMRDGDPSEVAELKLDTSRLERVIDSFLVRVRKEGARQVKAELAKARPTRPMRAAADGDERDEVPSTDVEENDAVVVAQRKALVRRMTNRLRSELETEALDALRTGDDAEEVVLRTVSKQLETGAFQADAGICTTRIFNLGRDEAARLMGASQVEYSAALDSATCSPCQGADGKRADVGSDEHDELLPPNRDCDGRDRCRCLLLYVASDAPEGDE